MLQGLPTLFATRSGMPLAEKVAISLNSIMHARFVELQGKTNRDALHDLELQRIGLMKAMNARLFGNDGSFNVRYLDNKNFGDGEIHSVAPNYRLKNDGPIIRNSVRGQHSFLIHSPYEPRTEEEDLFDGRKRFSMKRVRDIIERVREERSINDNVLEGLITAFTLAQRHSDVTLISPYHAYARQDHARGREAGIAKLMARLHESAGVGHFTFMDLHSTQIVEFYDVPADNLRASKVLIQGIDRLIIESGHDISEYVSLSLDAGSVGTAIHYANALGIGYVQGLKRRDYTKHNEVDSGKVGAGVRGKRLIIPDDIADSAGSLKTIIEEAIEQGAIEVIPVVTHPLYSGPALGRLDELHRKGLMHHMLDTDSVMRPPSFYGRHPWCKTISIAPPLGETIYNMTMAQNVGGIYEGTRDEVATITFPN